MINFRPIWGLSDNFGHRKRPNSIPSGYEDVKDPKVAVALSMEKWWPRDGSKGDKSVNPSRLKVVATRIARTAMIVFFGMV